MYVFSADDVPLLRSLGVTTHVLLHPPSLDVPVEVALPSRDLVALFCSVGSTEAPNAEGMSWFVRKVWPSVRSARVPSAVLVVAGAGEPPAAVRSVAGVRVVGDVEQLEPVYAASRIVVAPLLSGAGLKFKVPQAMAFGRAVAGDTDRCGGSAPVAAGRHAVRHR